MVVARTNRFHVKEIKDEVNITVEEERKDRSPFYLFLKRNQWLLYIMVLMIALIISSITLYVVAKNLDSSTVVEYEWNGVVVTFDEGNNSILDGVPITTEYASKLFDNSLLNDAYKGVVIKVKETKFASGQ